MSTTNQVHVSDTTLEQLILQASGAKNTNTTNLVRIIIENELPAHITDAKSLIEKYGTANNLKPVVYSVLTLDGAMLTGVCFQPESQKQGDRFHFDHGVGINKNTDALILWAGK